MAEYKRNRDKDRYYNNPKRREYLLRKGKERYRKYKKFIDEELGTQCHFCGFDNPHNKKNGLEKHEIHGEEHPKTQKYYRTHINDFILLCLHCHKAVHWCMNNLGMKWNDIKTLHHQNTQPI